VVASRAATEASQYVTRADYVEAVVTAVSILLISSGFVFGSWSSSLIGLYLIATRRTTFSVHFDFGSQT
jgi:hypothetical protein